MSSGEIRTVLLITGMKGNGCRETVAAALEAVSGVSEAHVNLYRGLAVVRHCPPCETSDLIVAADRAGYGASLASSAIGSQSTKKMKPGAKGGPGNTIAKETSS